MTQSLIAPREEFLGSPGWRHFKHASDIGIRGLGGSIEEAFSQAAIALTAVITDPKKVEAISPIHIRAKAPDVETLLVDWLNALILEMATRAMLFSRFQVQIEGCRLDAKAWGEPLDITRHAPAVEVKGATFTELVVTRNPQGLWSAQCVVDV